MVAYSTSAGKLTFLKSGASIPEVSYAFGRGLSVTDYRKLEPLVE
jgi:hypothetical protein